MKSQAIFVLFFTCNNFSNLYIDLEKWLFTYGLWWYNIEWNIQEIAFSGVECGKDEEKT